MTSFLLGIVQAFFPPPEMVPGRPLGYEETVHAFQKEGRLARCKKCGQKVMCCSFLDYVYCPNCSMALWDVHVRWEKTGIPPAQKAQRARLMEKRRKKRKKK